jgi:tetratricopeptide (TPR) repeat protein
VLILRYLKHSTIFILCFFIILFLLEIFIKTFIPQNIAPNYKTLSFGIPNALKANYNEKASSGIYTYRIQTNKKHLRRAKDISYKKPSNTFRILCLGDSMLFGAGVNNDENLTYFLEKILNEKFKEITFEVINAGVPNWGPLEYYLFLKNEGYKYSPDLILISPSFDDMSAFPQDKIKFKNLYYEKTLNKEVKIFLDEWEVRPNESIFFQQVLQVLQQNLLYESLTRSSHLLNLIRYRLSRLWIKGKNVKKNTPGSLEYFIEKINLKKTEKIIWVTPTSQTANQNLTTKSIQYYFLIDEIYKLTKKIKAKFLITNLPTSQQVLGLVNRIDGKNFISNNREVSFLRSLSQFQNKHLTFLYFAGDHHLTPAGHILSSFLLFNYLVESKMIPQSKTANINIDITNTKIIKMVKKSNLRIYSKLKESPKILFNKAVIYKNRGQLTLAKENIVRYLQKFKNDSEAYNMLGIINYKMGDILLAEKNTKKAIKINPNNYWYHLRLSGIYSYTGRHEEALQELKRTLELHPPEPKTLLLLGVSYLRLNNFKKALEAFNNVLRLQPENQMALGMLAEIRKRGLN